MKLKNKFNLLIVLGICAVFCGCAQVAGDTYASNDNGYINYATHKPVFDLLESEFISFDDEVDYSHLVKDGRFLSGTTIHKPKDKKGVKQSKTKYMEYKKVGYASWYASLFHGRQTTSGVEYDEYEYSAAHRTLPIPSVVKVINLENNKSVTVVVNDRGPFKGGKNRIIDLSRQAADDLDMIEQGTARVKIEFLAEETKKLIAHLRPKEQKKALIALNGIVN
jgi:rare lipoprotein A (peptidoglycan hydrolase)